MSIIYSSAAASASATPEKTPRSLRLFTTPEKNCLTVTLAVTLYFRKQSWFIWVYSTDAMPGILLLVIMPSVMVSSTSSS